MDIIKTKIIDKTNDLNHLKLEYDLIFAHFPGACMICDPNGLIIETNELFYKLMDCNKEELVNKSLSELLEFDKANGYIESLNKGETLTCKAKLINKANEIKNFEATIIPVIKNEFLIGSYVILLDDSEKMKTEINLNQLKENIIYGQQLAQIGSWTHDLINDEIFLSDEVYNILGCTPKEFDGKLENYLSFIHSEDKEKVKEATHRALYGKEYEIEYRIVTKGVTEKHIIEKTKAIFDENKKPVKMIGIMQDITKHKLLENHFKEFGESLDHAQRVLGVGSWKYDVLRNKIYCSDEVYRIYDLDPLNPIESFDTLNQLIHPDDKIKMQNAIEGCLKGNSYQVEYRIPKFDGSYIYVLSRGEPAYNERGEIVFIFGALQDITDKKLLERKSEENFKNLVKAQELAHIGSWESDILLNKGHWSYEACRICGFDEQYNGTFKEFSKYIHPDDLNIVYSVLENPRKEKYVDLQFRIIRPDGFIRSIYQIIEIVFDKDGNQIYMFGTIQDVTDIMDMQKTLEDKQEIINKIQRRFQVLVQDSVDVFEIISPEGIIQYLSPASEKITGYKPEERIGKNRLLLSDENEKVKLTQMIEQVLNNPEKEIKGDIISKTKDGKEIYLELNMSNQLTEPSIQGIVINWRDITERIIEQRKIAHFATHDEITGLPNHLFLKKQMKTKCESAKEQDITLGLIMVRIDGFKYVNDTLGQQLGDKLILQVLGRLKIVLEDKILICRYSADQFAIFIEDLKNIEQCESIARNIIGLFLHTFKVDKYELDVMANLGISLYPKDGQAADSLIKYANIALLRAKHEGNNKYEFYSSDMDIQNYKQFELRNDLRKAIEDGDSQFKVYYQPLVNLHTNDIIAAEALIRWEHPDWGMVSSGEFISLAEETGLIIDLGWWILRNVCKTYKKWIYDGLPAIKISINFSSIQFLEENFAENIKKTIAEFDLEPTFLIMEITESILMKNTEKAISDIQKLQGLGIQVALDDFGTGFSSLSYLSSFNIDILKIDHSFIKRVLIDKTSTTITRSVISLAKDLNIKLVAEGIETWDQLYFLQKFNCFTGQGFIYSKPISQHDFERMLIKKKCIPIEVNDYKEESNEDKREHFRITFPQFLEADMTIIKINSKKVSLGNTKVVIKNIGSGGICFVSDIKLPINRDVILKFTTNLLNKEVMVYGCIVWCQDIDEKLHEYGLEFALDDIERKELIKVLFQAQVKMRINFGFDDGRFVSNSPIRYFNRDK